MNVSIHVHGIDAWMGNFYDGVVGGTQYGIKEGETFEYLLYMRDSPGKINSS